MQSKNKKTALLNNLYEKMKKIGIELDEMTTSGNVGAYSTPNFILPRNKVKSRKKLLKKISKPFIKTKKDAE